MVELRNDFWDWGDRLAVDRLRRQLAFVLEIDRLKLVLRQSPLLDRSRKENSAEHSWHLAVMAIILAEHAIPDVDIGRAVTMLLIHDVVEIDAGDTFAYDVAANEDRMQREQEAAERLFGLLPEDQATELLALWAEFDLGESSDARFAAALDRLQPLLLNFYTGGGTWSEHGIPSDPVRQRNSQIERGAPRLWDLADRLIETAIDEGFLERSVDRTSDMTGDEL